MCRHYGAAIADVWDACTRPARLRRRLSAADARATLRPVTIIGLDHVQVSITAGGEDAARRFYGEVLGMSEVPKPASLAGRGGVWFACGAQQLHCGVEDQVASSRRHPALRTDDLDAVRARLEAAGFPIRTDAELPGYRRFYTEDPFGNRLECLEQIEDGERAAGAGR
jgi:catechol 2,3-dioxygenase-like lactoylglutathione lyase family enzyme